MRPFTSFTIHTLAATALVAFAASGAAAKGYIKLGDIKGEETSKGRGGEIEIESYSWGETRAASGAAQKLQPGGGGGAGGGVQVAAGDLDGDGRAEVTAASDIKSPRDASSGMPTGKRQHKPITITKEMDKSTPVLMQAKPLVIPHALERGSLTVKASLPGCTVGAEYADAELGTDAARYELKNVIITSCALEEISLNYGKVVVRGWDPAKKEE